MQNEKDVDVGPVCFLKRTQEAQGKANFRFTLYQLSAIMFNPVNLPQESHGASI